MRKSIFYSLLIYFLVISGCKSTKNQFSSSEQEMVVLTMQKSSCRGKCPVYVMDVYNTGKLVLDGKANIDYIGDFVGELDKNSLNQIVQEFENSDFQAFEDKYDSRITDIPSTYLTFKGKKVENRSGAPEKLDQLESTLTAVFKTTKWQEMED
ncbi:MAG: hypothetical protein ACI8WP_000966 [Flavobacteriaceae bacterium]|jgi:hypothetical protein